MGTTGRLRGPAARQESGRRGFPWLVALGVALSAAGCSTLLDIDHIEYGDPDGGAAGGGATGTGATGGGGTGGSGGSGAQAGDGGTTPAPTCDDGAQNGLEEGVDCGGPDCDPCDEDCTNGIDDGGNDLVDCEDPVCAGYECVPPAPAGWTGPAVLYLGDDDAADCASGWPDVGETGGAGTLTAPPATCTDCGCGSVSDASCSVPGVELFEFAACSGSLSTVTPAAADVCHSFSESGNVGSVGEAVTASGGSCSPSGGAPSTTAASWEDEALVCIGAAEGGGCEDDDVCVRSATGDFESTICIYRDLGNDQCPAGPYTERTLIYRSISDNRDCTDCDCGSPTGMTCSGTTTLYASAGCGNALASVPHDGATCVEHAEATSLMFTVDAGPSGGGCPDSGGEPTGTASGSGRVVVCCLP